MCNLILCTTLSPPRALLSVRESRIIVINVEKYLSPKVCLAKKFHFICLIVIVIGKDYFPSFRCFYHYVLLENTIATTTNPTYFAL